MTGGPRRIEVGDGPFDAPRLEAVADHLRRGGLIGYPTETVYGFGGLAHGAPVEALSRLKGGAPRVGFLVLLPQPGSVSELRWTPQALYLAERFWPGPLTLVLADPTGRFERPVRSTTGTVAVRVSSHWLAAAVTKAIGVPLTSTSANLPGEPPATTGLEALAAAERAGAGAEVWVLDVGSLPSRAPSTLVDVSGEDIRVLRHGAIEEAAIRSALREAHEPTC